MPKVSIIIPFNNVETYIEECLNSVCSQTLEDIEIICVNDASEDNSRKIVESFIEKDKRIKLIDLDKRFGQGYARNRAIEIAQGEYIGFVDSDDWVEADMFLELYNKAKENDDDIVICQAKEYDDVNEKFIISDYYSLNMLSEMEDRVFSASETKDEILDINVVLWNKIYKKEYLNKIGEKFPEGFIYEDLPFFFGTYLPAERIQIVWKNFYNYRINRKNSTMQQFNNKILDRLPMVSLTYEKMKQCPFLDDIRCRIQGWIINDLFHRYTLLKESYQKEYFFEMKKIFQSLDIQDNANPYWKKVYHYQGYLMVLNNTFEDFNQKVFNEYLDIHEVENRLRTEIALSGDIDKKISMVYSDINKTYEYTNKVVFDSAYQVRNDVISKIDKLDSEFSEEIKNVYEEISFNYDKSSEIFNSNLNNLKTQTDGAVSELRENYNSLNQELYEKFDMSNAMTDKKVSQMHSDLNNEVKSLYEKNTYNYNELNSLISNSIETLKQDLSRETEAKNGVVERKISNLNESLNSNISTLIKRIEEQDIKAQKDKDEIEKLKSDFESKMQEQKELYENQIKALTDRVNYLAQNPVKRFVGKIKKKLK